MGSSGGKLAALTGLARRSLRPETRVVVMVALHCDLTYLTDYSAVRPRGLLRLLREPPLADLSNIISSVDYEWRTHRGLKVIWAMPYVPSFLLYNQRRARLLNLGELGEMYTEEAAWSRGKMGEYVRQLALKLRGQNITVVDLAPWVPSLSVEQGSDGVHLGTTLRAAVFGELLREVLQILPHIALPTPIRELTIEKRWRRRQRRQRQRRLRRSGGRRSPSSAVARVGSEMVRENIAAVMRMAGCSSWDTRR